MIPIMEKVQKLTDYIDYFQMELEANPNQVTANQKSRCYSDLEALGFDYDIFSKNLIFLI